jgi:hypothetical protein
MPNRVSKTFLAACSALLLLSVRPASAEEMVVIVNASNPATTLTAQQVKHYFLKKTGAWQNGEKVRPVDREGQSPERAAFLAKVLGLSSDELMRYWLERQYASAEHPPASVPDEASIVKFVAFFKGGIGFVSRSGLARAEGVKPVLTLVF